MFSGPTNHRDAQRDAQLLLDITALEKTTHKYHRSLQPNSYHIQTLGTVPLSLNDIHDLADIWDLIDMELYRNQFKTRRESSLFDPLRRKVVDLTPFFQANISQSLYALLFNAQKKLIYPSSSSAGA